MGLLYPFTLLTVQRMHQLIQVGLSSVGRYSTDTVICHRQNGVELNYKCEAFYDAISFQILCYFVSRKIVPLKNYQLVQHFFHMNFLCI
jgi:hypothetical protein